MGRGSIFYVAMGLPHEHTYTNYCVVVPCIEWADDFDIRVRVWRQD